MRPYENALESLDATPRTPRLDGKTITGTEINAVRTRLMQAPGTKVVLQVFGKTGKREVSLTLAELF